MKMTKLLVIGGTVLALTASAGLAHGMMGGKGKMRMSEEDMATMKAERFAELDVNGDGELSFEEMLAGPKNQFADADTNGDGFITAEEMAAGIAKRAQDNSEKMATRMIERMDEDGDGKLSMDEIAEKMKDRMPSEDKIKERFDDADADGNGTISMEEFQEMKGERGWGGRGKGKGQ